jgi:serine O-acetyltransferase
MKLRDALRHVFMDYRRYRATGEKGWLQVVFLSQGFWASLVYRLSHWVYADFKLPVIWTVLRSITIIAQKGIEISTGISIPAGCRIGKGLYISHFGQIIINPETIIGDNCNLSQGVTMGLMSRGKHQGIPRIGNRVFVGPNAIILGGITVGDDAVIGAGAVVTQPVPPLAVVAGNPAKVISYQGSFDYVQYDHMEDDSERVAALKMKDAMNISRDR